MDKIEARPYGPDITEEEREALRERVCMHSDDTVVWHQVPIQTIYQLDIFEEKMFELTQELENFYLLIDLTEAARPTAEIIDYLRKIMRKFQGINHASVYTGKNFMLNIAAKFVLERVGFTEGYSRCQSISNKMAIGLSNTYWK